MKDLSFEQVIQCGEYRELFREFLRRTQCTESLDFIVDYLYRREEMPFADIVKTYVMVDSKKELNIDQQLRNSLMADFNYGVKDCSTSLGELYRFIALQLKESSFKPFTNQKEYKQILEMHYDKEKSMEELKEKDVSEWNSVEVYLYLKWHDMLYVLEDQVLMKAVAVGRRADLAGPRFFTLIETILFDNSSPPLRKRLKSKRHLRTMRDLLKLNSPESRNKGAQLNGELKLRLHSFVQRGNVLTAAHPAEIVKISSEMFTRNSEEWKTDSLSFLRTVVYCRLLNYEEILIEDEHSFDILMRDDEDDLITLTKSSDLNYLLWRNRRISCIDVHAIVKH